MGGGASAEHKAFQHRVGGEAVRAVNSGTGGLSAGVQPGDICPRAQVALNAADKVVLYRRDGYEVFGDVDAA